jgi:large subunit ribosomal protein L1
MSNKSKKLKELRSKVDRDKLYTLDEAVNLLSEMKGAKFDESIDMAIRLGIDPRKSDQAVRGTVGLPNGTGKSVKVLVFAKGDKEKEAEEAGADYVGADDLVKKVQDGWIDFDKAIATPDMMSQVGKLGKVLGPRGMMPNPKVGTVTMDIKKAVNELKGGRIEYKIDKGANIHCLIGKHSFGPDKIKENLLALFDAIQKAKPDTAKGNFIESVVVSTTMGPGIKIDPIDLRDQFK